MEQKIRDILEDLVENYHSGKDVDSAIKMILALLPPRQPAEGELAKCIYYDNCEARIDQEIDCDGDCGMTGQSKAQRAHDKATMVKLPSEEEFVEMLRLATEKALVKNKLGMVDNFNSIAQELLKLLKEQKP